MKKLTKSAECIKTLTLRRVDFRGDNTFGVLFDDKMEKICDTLEPPYAGTHDSDCVEFIESLKFGNIAIPDGKYRINMEHISPTFKDRDWAMKYNGIVPLLENVKGYEGILIHIGNWASQYGTSDTQGCILVGQREVGHLCCSRINYNRLMDNYLLPWHREGFEIYIDIVNS